MIFTVILGFLPGIMACEAVKKYERLDAAYGKLGVIHGICLVAAGLLGTVFALAITGINIKCIFSALVNIWMLLVTSYMDMRCGEFHKIILAVGLAVQIAVTIIGLLDGTSILFTGSNCRHLILYLIVLVVLKMAGLAAGDCLIYLCCGLSYLVLCGEYSSLAFWSTILFSSVTGGFFRFCKWIKDKVSKDILSMDTLSLDKNFLKQSFPFTVYIAAGCFFSYFLYGFFANAFLAGIRG